MLNLKHGFIVRLTFEIASQIYVREAENDIYAISRVLAPMPVIVKLSIILFICPEMSFKLEGAGRGNWEQLYMVLFMSNHIGNLHLYYEFEAV